MSSKHFPTLYVVDGHYPSFRELRGLEFDVKVVMHATDLTFDDGILREDQLQRLALTWNSHNALLAALEECEDHFDNRADVDDGSYGEPVPNAEMRLLEVVRAALKAAKGAA